jgi:hypothetical protein
MVRKTEHRVQSLLGNRIRINEIDPRFITKDLTTIDGILKFPYRLARTLGRELLYEYWKRGPGKGNRVFRPILMVGMPHSGTTVSMRLVAKHPDIVNYSEANTVLQPIGYFDFENGDHVRTRKEATPKEIDRLHSRFGFKAWYTGKTQVLNKSPNNTVRLDFLDAVFPDAVWIHVIRDGRAVVNSLIQGLPDDWETEDRFKPWRERVNPFPGVKPPNWRSLLRDDPIEQHALQWREVLDYALTLEKKLGLSIYHLKYEDLCSKPRMLIRDVYQYAGLEVNSKILESLPENLENRNYKWQDNFTANEVALINNIQKPMLERLGYTV